MYLYLSLRPIQLVVALARCLQTCVGYFQSMLCSALQKSTCGYTNVVWINEMMFKKIFVKKESTLGEMEGKTNEGKF